jgi:ubiquinone/menaquinone biosynthesis C-methylase UbiE
MGLFTHHHHSSQEKPASQTAGVFTMPAWLYDLMAQGFVLSGKGKEQTFRQMIVDLAQIQAGEAVLDVGCGTGTLAIVAKKRVGEIGRVYGIDPSAQLLAGARRKAARARLPIDFQQEGIERMPFPNQSFDLVLSTFMMHHLSDDLKRQGLSEIARVLKPQGRLLVVDFKHSEEHQKGSGQPGVGVMGLQDLPALMEEEGFTPMETGEMPFYIRMAAPGRQSCSFALMSKSQVTEQKPT